MGELVQLRHTGGIAAMGTGGSVLGETQARIPIGGKIRAGIKVLTSTASRHAKAGDIYRTGVLAGKTWDQIEKALKEACGFDKSPLTPRNVPYFTARRADFAVPEMADRIMDLYGEDRGDGLRLYRFPVVLPLETWLGNMPHGLKSFTKSEMAYWSDYGPDGNRYCYTRGKTEQDDRSRRARRVFGGRPVVLRADNEGRCDPNGCADYQAGKCKLSGGLVFYMPGIPGSSAIQMPTTSFYSLSQWRQQMETVGFIRGRLSGLGPDGRPVFWMVKRETEVSMIDPETGAPKRVKQWLVHLEADIDMSRVFAQDAAPALSAPEAAALLEHGADETDITPQAQEEEAVSAIKRLRAEVYQALQTLGIAPNQFDRSARQSWGDGWGTDLAALQSAKEELLRAGDNLPTYLARLKADFENVVPF